MSIVFFCIGGLLIGSFLNAAEYRYYKKLPINWDKIKREFARSFCPHCRAHLRNRDLLPVLSFVWLGGRCHHCRKKIAWQYPVVELSTGALFALAAWQFSFTPEAFIVAGFVAILIFIFIYDLKYQLIPDRVSLPAIALAIPGGLLLGLSWQSMALGALLGGGFFALQCILSRGTWVGGGDIRLGVLMGLLLGFPLTLLALGVAYVSGALVATILLATKKMGRKSKMPFGPFLVFATLVSLFIGDTLIAEYFNLLF